VKNLLKKLCFWQTELASIVGKSPKITRKSVTKTIEKEEDSFDVKVTLIFHTRIINGEEPKVEHTFKAFKTAYAYGYGYYVESGDNAYYNWLERNENVNIITVDGVPYLISNIKEIKKETIPVKLKYTETVTELEEIKDETSNN
jgi:hypothetical protein